MSIDYAQNSIGRNTATPYTWRARQAHPTVSTPLTWAELNEGTIDQARFSPQEVLERVRQQSDLFAPILQGDQRIA